MADELGVVVGFADDELSLVEDEANDERDSTKLDEGELLAFEDIKEAVDVAINASTEEGFEDSVSETMIEDKLSAVDETVEEAEDAKSEVVRVVTNVEPATLDESLVEGVAEEADKATSGNCIDDDDI